MKKSSIHIVVFMLILAMCVTPAIALNNQGLYWNISVDQRFDYGTHIETTLADETETRDTRWHIIIDAVPEISDDVDSFQGIYGAVNRTTYYENGTQPHYQFIWYALPVGNWNLIVNLWLDQFHLTQADIIDTPNLIGFSSTEDLGGGITCTYSEVYVKSTGVLQRYYTETTNTDLGFHLILETSLVEDLDVLLVVAVGSAAIALAAVAIIVIRKRQA